MEILTLVGFASAVAATPADPTACHRMKLAALGNGRIVQADWTTPPARADLEDPELNISIAVPFCRIVAELTPTSDSKIGVEVCCLRD